MTNPMRGQYLLTLEFIGDDGRDGAEFKDSVETLAVDEEGRGAFDAGDFAFLLLGFAARGGFVGVQVGAEFIHVQAGFGGPDQGARADGGFWLSGGRGANRERR